MADKYLSDIIDIIGGGTPVTSNAEFWNGDIPWISVVDFNNSQKYIYKTEKTITKKGLLNSTTKLLKQGDIILSARGTVGEIAILKYPMAFNQSCYGIRGKIDISYTDYLYYLIKFKINEIKQISHGGVFDTITRETFSNMEVSLPPFAEQKAIAAVLGSLDDKIDLLHRQNATLERMAETLFRQWFIEEAEEGWEEISLADIADNVKLIADPTYLENETKYIGLEHIEKNILHLKSLVVLKTLQAINISF